MARMDMMHQIQTNVTPQKDPINKMTIPNGIAQSGVPTVDDLQKQKLKEKITETVTEEMLNDQNI
jgi:hypothetical protein